MACGQYLGDENGRPVYCEDEATESHESGMRCAKCASSSEYAVTCPKCDHRFLVN